MPSMNRSVRVVLGRVVEDAHQVAAHDLVFRGERLPPRPDVLAMIVARARPQRR
jgi:hypothetical protein